MLNEEVAKYRELSGDTNPNVPISRIGGYLDGYEKALEQEPCPDAISRGFLMRDLLLKAQGEKDVSIKWLDNYINSLPPVTPQPKTGHWIKKEDDTCWWYVCSECEQEPLKNRWNNDDVLSRFCPNCGARMIKEDEQDARK